MEPISAANLRLVPAQGAAQQLADAHHAIVSCDRCPRLRTYCSRIASEKKRAYRDEVYWGRPVPGFGDPSARLLLLGLAPAAHGANRTGRVFTGDGTGGSGDFLMAALHRTGFANITTSEHTDDGLRLTDAYIAAAVRCAPPDNKPRPEEITRCLDHLDAEVSALPNVQVVVALGKIAFDAWLQLLRRRSIVFGGSASHGDQARRNPPYKRPQFGHGVIVNSGGFRLKAEATQSLTLIGCYHPSRQNTNTGKLTPRMMVELFRKARKLL
jgi:uracil-DNA glycosylase family 4